MRKDLKPTELQDPLLINGNRALMYRLYARNHMEERQWKKCSQTKKTLEVNMMNDRVIG